MKNDFFFFDSIIFYFYFKTFILSIVRVCEAGTVVNLLTKYLQLVNCNYGR